MKALTALLTAIACMLLVASATMAQTTHPDPTAVLIGSFQTTISVSGSSSGGGGGGISAQSTTPDECQIKANVTVWRTSSGAIEYVIDAASIVYSGSCSGISLTTSEIFGQLSTAALRQGIQNGYSPCNPDCTQSNNSRVYTALCVQKTGSGTSTRYEPCSTSTCYREYSYCCPNGTLSPQITEVPRTGDGCGAGVPASCESTCYGSSSKEIK